MKTSVSYCEPSKIRNKTSQSIFSEWVLIKMPLLLVHGFLACACSPNFATLAFHAAKFSPLFFYFLQYIVQERGKTNGIFSVEQPCIWLKPWADECLYKNFLTGSDRVQVLSKLGKEVAPCCTLPTLGRFTHAAEAYLSFQSFKL